MSLPSNTGYLDQSLNQVFPNNTDTWSALSGTTWADWKNWIRTPVETLEWLSDVIEFDEITTFNLKITTVANGLVSYDVYTSTTGAFTGEETVTTINQGDANIPSFTAYKAFVLIKVQRTQGVNTLDSVEIKANDSRINILLKDIDTSALAGTNTARTLSLPRAIGVVFDMLITPKKLASAYTLDLYVSSTQTSTQLVPQIVSKSSTPQIALYGLDNQPRDGVVDVAIWALPEQYMQGNNLTTR